MATDCSQSCPWARTVWGGHDALNRPARVQPIIDDVIRDAQIVRPGCHGHDFPVIFDEMRISAISCLRFTISPAAVFRRVWTIIVNAVEGHSGGGALPCRR